jgi:peptide/nickel transport system permease protein
MLGQYTTPEAVAALRKELMLELPVHTRYLNWIRGLLQGDLGVSLANGTSIADMLSQRLPNTLFLAAFAAAISVPLALSLALLSALFRGTPIDHGVNLIAIGAVALPEFFVAYVLILMLAVNWPLFPPLSIVGPMDTFWDRIYKASLPAITLTLATAPHMMRMTRASIISLLSSPYIEMAQLKGIRPLRIIIRHALPNALGPIANVIALNLAILVVGVVVVETIFVYPGLGQLLVDSVSKRDFPVVQVVSLIFATTYILLNLLADIIATVTNPRLLYPR